MVEKNIPMIELNDGNKIPQLGLGTFLMSQDECEDAVLNAFETGYRHIDTATVYDNEKQVGLALSKSGLKRGDIFLTTKLANSDQTDPHGGFQRSLDKLGVDYVDLYLLHWPLPKRSSALGAWKGIIEIAESGAAKSIGVCNFEIEHLEMIISETGVVPSVNQIELHPEHQRSELVAYCREKGIATQSWGPLAQMKSNLLEKPEILEAAAVYNKTPAQIVLRWHIEHGHIIIPKTVNTSRMKENFEIFDFSLSQKEVSTIDSLESGTNYGPDPRNYDG
ncbi:MAG TPA: aldo/keto reductase [Microbacteriaceae bacterium]|nr:aldo/keto reductase [Microbacteriaceae bacterium]